MQCITNVLFFFLLNALFAQSLVHKLTATEQEVPHKMSLKKRFDNNRFLVQHIGADVFKEAAQKPISSVQLKEHFLVFLGNISVGTPAQNFTVEFDLWGSTDLNVLGEKFNKTKWWFGPKKQVYFPNNSTSFTNVTGNFSHSGWKGHLSADIVNVAGQSADITFGVIDKLGFFSSHYTADGLLGLSIADSENTEQNAVTQLLANADKPIISQWWNNTNLLRRQVQVTLGGEDTDNCQSDWTYVPGGGHLYSFNTSGASATVNGSKQSINFNATASVVPVIFNSIYGPRSLQLLFVNASNGVFNYTVGAYVVDCDLSKAASVSLDIGSSDSAEDSKQLVLTGADYISYSDDFDVCYVNVFGSLFSTNTVLLGKQIVQNHCLAYNTKERLVGFANAKNVPTNLSA